MKSFFNTLHIVLFTSYLLSSCTTIDLYEKNVSIHKQQWAGSFKPKFTFTINDTTAIYDVMLTLRHNEKYNYNNIWLNLSIESPGDSTRTIRVEKTLATNKDGWLGTAMDDIYEHRLSLSKELADSGFSFRKSGDYTFTIEQIMREDPLQNMMNVGIRVEKKQ